MLAVGQWMAPVRDTGRADAFAVRSQMGASAGILTRLAVPSGIRQEEVVKIFSGQFLIATRGLVFALLASPILPSHADDGVTPKRIVIGQSAAFGGPASERGTEMQSGPSGSRFVELTVITKEGKFLR